MNPELEALRAQVERVNGVGASAVAALNGLGQFIRDHATEPAVLRQFAEGLSANADALAAAIAANPLPTDGGTPPPAAPKK